MQGFVDPLRMVMGWWSKTAASAAAAGAIAVGGVETSALSVNDADRVKITATDEEKRSDVVSAQAVMQSGVTARVETKRTSITVSGTSVLAVTARQSLAVQPVVDAVTRSETASSGDEIARQLNADDISVSGVSAQQEIKKSLIVDENDVKP